MAFGPELASLRTDREQSHKTNNSSDILICALHVTRLAFNIFFGK